MSRLFFSGFVERGDGMATKLGCPTANVSVAVGAVIPGLGVYLAETETGGVRYQSLVCVNDGREGNQLKLEVHLLLDSCPELHGKFLKVALLEKMRSLVPFESEEQMRALIAQDIIRAQEWFASGRASHS